MVPLEDKTVDVIGERPKHPSLLVLEDVEETARLIEKMLYNDGYCVTVAKSEEDAIFRARFNPPDLILISVDTGTEKVLETANRIRREAGIREEVAIVVFCMETIPEGAVMDVGTNTYLIRPDNFNQLRDVLHHLLWKEAGR